MNKSKIEWTDYTINPVKGLCPMACSYCYASRMYKRFKWNPELKYVSRWWSPLTDLRIKPSRIFVGSTMELFGDFIPADWTKAIIGITKDFPEHTFIFLTKQSQNLIKWSPFPDNCWVGASVTDQASYEKAIKYLKDVEATIKFLSFEPLLSEIKLSLPLRERGLKRISWVIIGQVTPVKKSTMPKIGWVEEIVRACDKANIPVFLKDNLISCVDQYPFAFSGKFPDIKLRQEFPVGNLR